MRILTILSILFIAQLAISQSYISVESVEYDASQDRWIVANGINLLQRDSDDNLDFFGIDAGSLGTEVMGGNLYTVASSTLIRVFNLETEELIGTVNISGAQFLNGMTNDGNGNLYVTDFVGRSIYRIDASDPTAPTFETIVSSLPKTPNGIVFDEDNNRLLWVSWGTAASVRAIDLEDLNSYIVYETEFQNFDGIDDDADGNYYVSSWTPSQILKFDKDFSSEPTVLETPPLTNPADIGVSKETNTIGIPMSTDVIYVSLGNSTSTEDEVSIVSKMEIFPNPGTSDFRLQYTLDRSSDVAITLLNQEGRNVAELFRGQQAQGTYFTEAIDQVLPSGMYYVNIVTEGKTQTIKYIVE